MGIAKWPGIWHAQDTDTPDNPNEGGDRKTGAKMAQTLDGQAQDKMAALQDDT